MRHRIAILVMALITLFLSACLSLDKKIDSTVILPLYPQLHLGRWIEYSQYLSGLSKEGLKLAHQKALRACGDKKGLNYRIRLTLIDTYRSLSLNKHDKAEKILTKLEKDKRIKYDLKSFLQFLKTQIRNEKKLLSDYKQEHSIRLTLERKIKELTKIEQVIEQHSKR